MCAALIEYLRADLGGQNAYPAALRLDSVSRSVPWGLYDGGLEPTMGLAEVILSRAFAQYGEPAQALRAARRRTYTAFQGWWVWADQLREEARLAVMVGDTAGAIGVYDHYLMLRSERPEHPAWAAQWDSVRAELAALVAR
ncbi:MAG: hypothetical protein IH616_02290 [Gemmatimonadales bacterium]|nr:hypothetical protein [Gemmatimonadales bacterium]